MKRQEIEAKLIAKSLADDSFREKLLADPKAAIEEALKIPVRDGVEVCVVEETPEKFFIVIPAKKELSDAELDAVAGGLQTHRWYPSISLSDSSN